MTPLSIPCPVCSAPVGAECVGIAFGPQRTHDARIEAASIDGLHGRLISEIGRLQIMIVKVLAALGLDLHVTVEQAVEAIERLRATKLAADNAAEVERLRGAAARLTAERDGHCHRLARFFNAIGIPLEATYADALAAIERLGKERDEFEKAATSLAADIEAERSEADDEITRLRREADGARVEREEAGAAFARERQRADDAIAEVEQLKRAASKEQGG
jgi:hypothetical protein